MPSAVRFLDFCFLDSALELNLALEQSNLNYLNLLVFCPHLLEFLFHHHHLPLQFQTFLLLELGLLLTTFCLFEHICLLKRGFWIAINLLDELRMLLRQLDCLHQLLVHKFLPFQINMRLGRSPLHVVLLPNACLIFLLNAIQLWFVLSVFKINLHLLFLLTIEHLLVFFIQINDLNIFPGLIPQIFGHILLFSFNLNYFGVSLRIEDGRFTHSNFLCVQSEEPFLFIQSFILQIKLALAIGRGLFVFKPDLQQCGFALFNNYR